MRMHHFRAENGPMATKNFFEKKKKIPMHLFVPFIVQNFKKMLRADPELCVILEPKIPQLL